MSLHPIDTLPAHVASAMSRASHALKRIPKATEALGTNYDKHQVYIAAKKSGNQQYQHNRNNQHNHKYQPNQHNHDNHDNHDAPQPVDNHDAHCGESSEFYERLVTVGRRNLITRCERSQAYKLSYHVKVAERQHNIPVTPENRLVAFHAATNGLKGALKLLPHYFSSFNRVKCTLTEEEVMTAIEKVNAMPESELPRLRGDFNEHKESRRVLALHRELARLSNGETYCLSAAYTLKVLPAETQQNSDATDIHDMLAQLGSIEIIDRGKSASKGVKGVPACYRYTHQEAA